MCPSGGAIYFAFGTVVRSLVHFGCRTATLTHNGDEDYNENLHVKAIYVETW